MRGRVVSKSHTKAQRLELWENGFKTTKVIEPSYNVIVEYKGDTMTIPTDYNTYNSIQVNDIYDLDGNVKSVNLFGD